MMRASRAGLRIVALLACVSCRPSEEAAAAFMQNPEVAARASRFDQALSQPKPAGEESQEGSAPIARWILPASLREISGIALSPDGRLFAHGDERGVVTVLDYRTGVLMKEFVVGKRSNTVDFEGITFANETIFMIASDGDLYEFREGSGGSAVPFAIHKTKLEKECEFEGVAYDRAIESLLLACKNVRLDGLKDSLVIFRWKLKESSNDERLTRLTLPLASVAAPIQSKTMRPTDIAVDPVSGNYLLVAAQERALIEITPTGVVLFVRQLSAEHEQAEGLAITKDGVIIISDEAARTSAMITLYRKQ